MDKKILVIYKSTTGFTKEYAQMIAQELNCPLMDYKNVTANIMSTYETIIFGGRMHAGKVDGLIKVKELFQQSNASRFIVYASGATPNEENEMIEKMWNENLSPEELLHIPHFYMQAGLRYERMPFLDKMVMKVFSKMMKKKKDKTDYEVKAAEMMASSYDISSKAYVMPLITLLKQGDKDDEES